MARLTTLLFAMWLGVTVSTVVDLKKRIIGGHDCLQTERQYHVKVKGTNGTHISLCGSSLISDQWILTAAHCFKPGWTFTAHIGVHAGTLQEVDITEKPKIFKRFFFFKQDLMLLQLPNPVGIQPVQGPDCQHRPNVGAVVQVAGHAATAAGPNNEKLIDSSPTLQCADMNIDVCSWTFLQLEKRICYSAPGVDTCKGDSGGGVVFNGRIYGVHVRSGTHVCSAAAQAMDLCYQPYFDWINTIINPPGANAAFGIW